MRDRLAAGLLVKCSFTTILTCHPGGAVGLVSAVRACALWALPPAAARFNIMNHEKRKTKRATRYTSLQTHNKNPFLCRRTARFI